MTLRAIFRFLGGIPFALILIAATAGFAMAGTFLESATESHRYAALFTYNSPLFSLLLWGFFLNILISALRRYPFKLRHLPFLITHFGMLMVLAGALIKNHYGTQGTMTIIEGGASDEIFLAESYALLVEAKEAPIPQFFTFNSHFPRFSRLQPLDYKSSPPYDQLVITLLDHTPNSSEQLDSWIKWDHTSIFGMRPQLMQSYTSVDEELPLGEKVKLPHSDEAWTMLTLQVEDVKAVAQKAYDRALRKGMPTLLMLQDPQKDLFLFAITKEGKVGMTLQRQGELERILAYDDGYLGYSVEATFPELKDDSLKLESPLIARQQVIPPSKKLESNIPCVALRFKNNDKEEILSLSYNPVGSGFKWPVLNGEFIVRFQPLFKKIPYRLRLRQARQINYADSQQPFSYESDLIITDKLTGHNVESSISMNNVYETWDGYRFYLANISPPEKGALKRVQIVVNRDPAKYWLTYPGAVMMTLGILLLFFMGKRK